jgi:hypothetical protein
MHMRPIARTICDDATAVSLFAQPVLKGLADDLCSCPHWGYVTKGAIHLKYKDGSEEVARAGDLWHTPPGHTAWCNEDSEFVEFSPQHELLKLLEHVRRQVQASSR